MVPPRAILPAIANEVDSIFNVQRARSCMNKKKLPKAVTKTADEMRKAGTDEAASKIEIGFAWRPRLTGGDARHVRSQSECNRRALCEFLRIGRGHPGSADQCRGRDSHYSSNGQEAVSALRRSLRTRSRPRTHRRTGRRCRPYDGFRGHDINTRLFYSWRESLGAGGFVRHRIRCAPAASEDASSSISRRARL